VSREAFERRHVGGIEGRGFMDFIYVYDECGLPVIRLFQPVTIVSLILSFVSID
jgi:hypothetical protein